MALDVYQQELNRLMQPPTCSANVSTTTTATITGNFTSTPVGSAGSQNQSTTPTTSAKQQNLSNGFPQDLSLPKSSTGARSDEESSERDAAKIRSANKPSSSSSFLLNLSENGERSKSETAPSKSTENSIGLFMPHSLHNILRPSSSLQLKIPGRTEKPNSRPFLISPSYRHGAFTKRGHLLCAPQVTIQSILLSFSLYFCWPGSIVPCNHS